MFFGNFFSNAFNDLSGLGGAFLAFGELTNFFFNQQSRLSQQKQYNFQAQQLANKAVEEDYRYRALAHNLDLKGQSDIKKYLTGVSTSGFTFSGSVLDNVSQIRNMVYSEKEYNEKVRSDTVSSLLNSAYNYNRESSKIGKYGFLADVGGVFSMATKAEFFKEKY